MRKQDNDQIKKITLIAEMHYIHKQSQKDIAKRMGMSRPWVSKLLKRAEELGIVHIEVNSPLTGCEDLERHIREKYRIDHVSVIKPAEENSYISVGHAAANYFVSQIMPGDVIGVSWGMSIAKMIDYIVPVHVEDVTVVPIVGGAGSNAECLSNVCADRIATAIDAQCKLFHANAYCSNMVEHQAIMSNPITKRAINTAEHANIVLVGIGALKNNRVMTYGYLNQADQDDLEEQGAVGDIALRFIDKGGDIIDTEANKRVVAANLETVRRNAREIIAIAFGREKAEVIKAVLKGRLITTLFTDFETAERLL